MVLGNKNRLKRAYFELVLNVFVGMQADLFANLLGLQADIFARSDFFLKYVWLQTCIFFSFVWLQTYSNSMSWKAVRSQSLLRNSGFLRGDPGVDAVAENVKRESAGVEQLVVEGAQIELVAERFFCTVAQFEDF